MPGGLGRGTPSQGRPHADLLLACCSLVQVAQALDVLPSAGAAYVEEGPEGSTTYRFGGGVPSAADFTKAVEAINGVNGSHAAK